jgi:hypothetical protein
MKTILIKLLLLVLSITLSVAAGGCGGGSGATSLFFKVHTTIIQNGLSVDEANVTVGGFVPLFGITLANACSQNPTGMTAFGPDNTDSNGMFTVSDSNSGVAIGPSCTWEFQRDVSAQCSVPTINDSQNVTFSGQTVPLPCGVAVNTFTASPSKIDPGNPPATVTITGQNMTATYAMPHVRFYDQSHTLFLEVTALSASSDGTTLVFPGSQITFTGRFSATVYVMDANGNWDAVGGAAITVAPPPPPSPTPIPRCTGNECLPQN